MSKILPKIYHKEVHVDDRGSVHTAFDGMDVLGIKRTYVVRNRERGMVRAWHGHRRGDTYMMVIRGAAKIVAVDMENHENWMEVTLDESKPGVLRVPAGHYNGSCSLLDDTRILVFSTLNLKEVKDDDERAPAPSILPDVWKVKPR